MQRAVECCHLVNLYQLSVSEYKEASKTCRAPRIKLSGTQPAFEPKFYYVNSRCQEVYKADGRRHFVRGNARRLKTPGRGPWPGCQQNENAWQQMERTWLKASGLLPDE